MPKPKAINRVVDLRKRLGFTPGEMADLLGVNVATIYRWEAAEGKLHVEPLQAKIMEYLSYRLDAMACDKFASEVIHLWVKTLKARITIGGTLNGLSFLLRPLSDHT